MEKALICFLILLLSGCSSTGKLKEDYLNVDDPARQSFGEAMETLKTDYLGANENLSIVNKKAEVIAYNTIMETEYKDDFEIYKPKADNKVGMPQMKPYVFALFEPKEECAKFKGIEYLVVIKVLDDSVVYSGLFKTPGGDPFYRYNEVINDIERK